MQVLDHGYIKHIESWGLGEAGLAEAGIIEAARQSTQGSFRGWDQDEKLLRFMYSHHHSTPFEFAGMVIEVQAPIFVFREWHRHRTQCLAGDTLINLVSPRGTTYKRTIQQLFELKHGGVVDRRSRHKNGTSKTGIPMTRAARYRDPWRTRILPNCQNRILRTFNEGTYEYEAGSMREVWESGYKELWQVVTSAGTVRASAQHPFLTHQGWVKVEDLRKGDLVATSGKVASHERPIPPSLRQGIGVWTSMMRKRLILPVDYCYVCSIPFAFDDLQLDHVIPVYENLKLALDENNLKPICEYCHRTKINKEQPDRRGQSKLGLVWAKIEKSPSMVAEAMTYDLEMDGTNHNYVANGLVVHNSYNEMSARYSPLPDINYIPSIERCMTIQKGNKQAEAIAELTKGSAEIWQSQLNIFYTEAERLYQEGLRRGIPKELARIILPVGRYSRMRASANLRNWLAFLTLRMHPDAQWEIRQFADAMGCIVRERFPRTWGLFECNS